MPHTVHNPTVIDTNVAQLLPAAKMHLGNVSSKAVTMSQLIGNKLDFLMRLTDTRNSTLARALNFDPSYISRIRANRRGIPRNQDFIEPAAHVFAHKLTGHLEQEIFASTLGIPQDQLPLGKGLEEVIASWLDDGLPMGHAKPKPSMANVSAHEDRWLAGIPTSVAPAQVLLGRQGRREAFLRLLTLVAKPDGPNQLLIYSSEDTSWLFQDPDYTQLWSEAMLKVIRTGTQITVIHSINRNIGEMLDGLRKWIPLYATGAIRPLYCPRIRDGIFRESLYVAPGQAAMAAYSCDAMETAPLTFVTDQATVEAFVQQFRAFEGLCTDLGHAYSPNDVAELLGELNRVRHASKKLIHLGAAPSLATLPEGVAQSWARRHSSPLPLQARRQSKDWARSYLEAGNTIVDIVRDEKEPCATVPLQAMDIRYSQEERQRHIESARCLAQKYENYELYEIGSHPEGISVVVAEDHAALASFQETPGVTMSLFEPRLVSALGEFLERLAR